MIFALLLKHMILIGNVIKTGRRVIQDEEVDLDPDMWGRHWDFIDGHNIHSQLHAPFIMVTRCLGD